MNAEQIQRAHQSMLQGNYGQARQLLEGASDPTSLHLRALVEKRAGDDTSALSWFDQALSLDANNPEIHNNKGLSLRNLSRFEEAKHHFETALRLRPNYTSASISLARTCISLRLFDAACRILEVARRYDPKSLNLELAIARTHISARRYPIALQAALRARALNPEHPMVRYEYASALLETGQTQAACDELEHLVQRPDVQPGMLYLYARSLLQLGRLAECLSVARRAHALQPSSETLTLLAEVSWMQNDQDGFAEFLAGTESIPELALTAINLLRAAEQPEQAANYYSSTPLDFQASDVGRAAHCAVLTANGDLDRAVTVGRGISSAFPPSENGAFVSALLRNGRPEEALGHIELARRDDPESQFWLGYEALALRLLGDPRYSKLVDCEQYVRAFKLTPPPGYSDIGAFNRDLFQCLTDLQVFETHPLNQSFRGGTQAPVNLAAVENPVIAAYFKALDGPIRSYMQAIGNSPDHPTTARNTGNYQIAGSWTIALKSGGHHVNHVHPRGWISSAYYVKVPSDVGPGEDRQGWIKFMEAPFELDPPLMPEKWVSPEEGTLVLFPSFYWHGTQPFTGQELRVTAPFDVVPV